MDLLSPDKIIHILLYGVLQYLIVQNLFLIKKFSFSKSILIATLITTPLAALTEILQGILPIKRCMSQYDFIANVMGILLAILILYRQNKKAESPME